VPELDIQGILERLARAGVSHIVIGGVAVGFHGYVRATKDLDIVPAPDRDNLERLVAVLRALDAELDGAGDFDPGELPDPLDPDTLGERELWEMLSPSAVEVDLDGVPVKVASYEDLVTLKRQAARPSDLEDLERLRQARGE
jgi:predicted nucleotidyltransferase